MHFKTNSKHGPSAHHSNPSPTLDSTTAGWSRTEFFGNILRVFLLSFMNYLYEIKKKNKVYICMHILGIQWNWWFIEDFERVVLPVLYTVAL